MPLTKRIALSPDEASAISGIGVTKIREAAASGILEAHKHGCRTIILRDVWSRGSKACQKQLAQRRLPRLK